MLRILVPLVVISLVSAQTPKPGPTPVLQVVARAGALVRSDSPAQARFAWPNGLSDALAALDSDRPLLWHARLLAGADTEVACEVRAYPANAEAPAFGELRFVVDHLDANEERRYSLQLADGAAPKVAPTGSAKDDEREIAADNHPILRLQTAFDRADFEPTNKPIWHLFVPGTDVPLTKGIGGEYPHHRGLFLGWNQTTVGDAKFDFWHCPVAGQRHAGFDLESEVHSGVRRELRSTTHWLTPLDEIVLRDQRCLTAWVQRSTGKDGSAMQCIDVAIELSADQVVALRGDPQHAGFQLRVADEVAQRKDARYVRPTSAHGGDNDVWNDCAWVTGLFTIAGHQVAVQHMSHRDNPQPVCYATRPYGRFGAFFTADVSPGKPLRLRYRLRMLAITEHTDVSVDRFTADYADFVAPIEVVITGT